MSYRGSPFAVARTFVRQARGSIGNILKKWRMRRNHSGTDHTRGDKHTLYTYPPCIKRDTRAKPKIPAKTAYVIKDKSDNIVNYNESNTHHHFLAQSRWPTPAKLLAPPTVFIILLLSTNDNSVSIHLVRAYHTHSLTSRRLVSPLCLFARFPPLPRETPLRASKMDGGVTWCTAWVKGALFFFYINNWVYNYCWSLGGRGSLGIQFSLLMLFGKWDFVLYSGNFRIWLGWRLPVGREEGGRFKFLGKHLCISQKCAVLWMKNCFRWLMGRQG